MNESDEIRKILTSYRNVAVVGLSPNPERASYEVAAYLKKAGYRIVPVNPSCDEVLGERCYPSLAEIPGEVEIVDIFRRSEFVPEVVEEAIARKARVVWMQLGVIHHEAARRAEEAGLAVVMDRCILQEHARLLPQR